MTPSRQSEQIQLDEDIEFQSRMWRLQSAGFVVMIAVVAAGLLGLLGGNGPLARGTAGAPAAGLTAEYQQFLRRRASTSLVIHIQDTESAATDLAVHVDRAYIERFEIRTINPEPVQVEAGDEDITYYFELTGSGSETTLTFHLDPQQIGRTTGRLRIDEHAPVEFWQFVYP